MANPKGVKVTATPKVVAKTDFTVGVELGVANLLPASSWQDWSAKSSPSKPGMFRVSRDPLAPTQDDMVYMLRRDGQARALLNLLTLPIRSAFSQSEWISADGQSDGPETQFANDMWTLPSTGGGMSVSSSMFLRQTLLALAHGFSAFEICRKIPTDGPLKGKLTIDKMGYRDPRTVTFLVDDHGNYEGFKQVTNFANRFIDVSIAAEDTWYFAANEEENPFYGISYFEPAYQHYLAKRKMYYIGELASQMAAVPGRIGKIPLGAAPRQIAEFKKGIENFSFNNSLVVGPNFEVEALNTNSNFKFLELIDHHNTMMASSILAKFYQAEDRAILVDTGKADASADMFVQLLEAITSELSESWTTRLMPQFIDANFGSGNYPIHRFAPLTDENKQAVKELFELTVAATSLNCTPEFVRITEQKLSERLGYDIDYDEVARKEAEIAVEQQKQMALDAEAARQAQVAEAKQTGNGNGPPKPGQANTGGNPAAKKVKQQPGNPAAKKPLTQSSVKTAAEQQDAADRLVVLLSDLFNEEDVPEEFISPEGEALPEAGDL